ncbi:hypothetical protein B0H12DRAFT_1234839 [Mycena haematopus]|nr:hypothetical protein B0H12DRAFT_1234839 [Mycena haematopus]
MSSAPRTYVLVLTPHLIILITTPGLICRFKLQDQCGVLPLVLLLASPVSLPFLHELTSPRTWPFRLPDDLTQESNVRVTFLEFLVWCGVFETPGPLSEAVSPKSARDSCVWWLGEVYGSLRPRPIHPSGLPTVAW